MRLHRVLRCGFVSFESSSAESRMRTLVCRERESLALPRPDHCLLCRAREGATPPRLRRSFLR
jgi:hypothetical protein